MTGIVGSTGSVMKREKKFEDGTTWEVYISHAKEERLRVSIDLSARNLFK
jgi:hypothetical protein